VRDLNSIRDSRPFRRLFRFPHVNGVEDLRDEVSQLRGGTGAYTQRALWRGVVRNPVAATVHFHRRVMIMNRVLLGISVSQPRTPPFATLPKGALGRLRTCAVLDGARCVRAYRQVSCYVGVGWRLSRSVTVVTRSTCTC
jgi:hypothetical protein